MNGLINWPVRGVDTGDAAVTYVSVKRTGDSCWHEAAGWQDTGGGRCWGGGVEEWLRTEL